MLRILSLTPAQQRELRRWQHGGDFHLARRAPFVLWSASGWSVPALACMMGCCRRTVRRWLHAFLAAGMAGLQGHCTGRARRREETVDSAIGGDDTVTSSRVVPVVPISLPELRRILAFHWYSDPVSPEHFWHWSTYRRYKQALAKRSHYKKRGAVPPAFKHVRL